MSVLLTDFFNNRGDRNKQATLQHPILQFLRDYEQTDPVYKYQAVVPVTILNLG